MTITWDLGATGANTIGTETPLTSQVTHPFTPQLALTGGAHVDVQPSANYEPDMDPQNDGNAYYTFASGVSAELLRGAVSESSALVAPVDRSRATQDMHMIRDRDIEPASFFCSPSMLDLTVVAASAEASLHHPYTSQ